jgi:hypothetical protein
MEGELVGLADGLLLNVGFDEGTELGLVEVEGEALGLSVGAELMEGESVGLADGLLLNEGFDVGSELGREEIEGEALG